MFLFHTPPPLRGGGFLRTVYPVRYRLYTHGSTARVYLTGYTGFMSRTMSFRFLLVICVTIAVLPFVVNAQNVSADLRATIRAELLSDPRTSSLSGAQIDALVGLLANEAEKQGITSQDIQWRPESSERFVATESAAPQAPECAGGFLCTMTEAFCFIGAGIRT